MVILNKLVVVIIVEIKTLDPQEVRTKQGPGVHGPPILDRVHGPLIQTGPWTPVMDRVHAPLEKKKERRSNEQ